MQTADPIVFIVNADTHLRSRLEYIARSGGFNAIAFASAADFLAYPRSDLPACHILGIAPGDTSSLALQLSLAATEPAAVVFVSRQADVACSAQVFKAGALDFLTAPFADADLLRAIEDAVRRAKDLHARRQRAALLRQRLNHLTEREREVLQLVVSGCLNKQVAATLGISEITVKAHRGRVMAKMLADSFADLVRMAAELHLPIIATRHDVRRVDTGWGQPTSACA